MKICIMCYAYFNRTINVTSPYKLGALRSAEESFAMVLILSFIMILGRLILSWSLCAKIWPATLFFSDLTKCWHFFLFLAYISKSKRFFQQHHSIQFKEDTFFLYFSYLTFFCKTNRFLTMPNSFYLLFNHRISGSEGSVLGDVWNSLDGSLN